MSNRFYLTEGFSTTVDEKLRRGSLRLIAEDVDGTELRLVESSWSRRRFYVDKNGNSWGANGFSAQQAAEASRTLVNCSECDNCFNCEDCNFCQNCEDCKTCLLCHDCKNCIHCHKCINCQECSYLAGCGYCQKAEHRKKVDYINHSRIPEQVQFGDYGYLWPVY